MVTNDRQLAISVIESMGKLKPQYVYVVSLNKVNRKDIRK